MAYRLYSLVPQLGQDDGWGIDWGGLFNTATSTAADVYAAQQKAAAQQEAAKAALQQTQAQTALTRAQAALKQAGAAVVAHPVATGTIVAVAAAAVGLFLFMRKK